MNFALLFAALVPPVAVTRTSTTPDPAGDTAVKVELLEVVTDVAAVPPKVTPVTPVKFVPVIVTVVPPAAGPPVGLTFVTVGAATPVSVAVLAALATPLIVTMNFTAEPAPMSVPTVATSVVEET